MRNMFPYEKYDFQLWCERVFQLIKRMDAIETMIPKPEEFQEVRDTAREAKHLAEDALREGREQKVEYNSAVSKIFDKLEELRDEVVRAKGFWTGIVVAAIFVSTLIGFAISYFVGK